MTVYDEVIAERTRQDEKWGGADHDDQHTGADWAQLIQDYAGWVRVMSGMGSADKARRRLVQVAALAVAAVEAVDRFRSHEDDMAQAMNDLRAD